MNPEQTILPFDWKPLREAAEAMALDLYAVPDWYSDDPDPPNTLWSDLGDRMRDKVIDHVSARLADLTRPASRDFWARWLARTVGLTVGATAPEWRRLCLYLPNGTESWAWALLCSPGGQFIFTDGNALGISAVTDPAAALRLAMLAVGGKS